MDTTKATRRSAALFFVLAFALTWSCWIPWAVWMSGQQTIPAASPMMLLNLLGTLGPALAAVLLTAVVAGKRATLALLGRLRDWRVAAQWYAVALLLWPVLLLVALLIERALGGGSNIVWSGLLPQLVVASIVSIGEEIGWRGYALPALLRRHGAAAASMVLGAVWTAWHLPVYFAVVGLSGAELAIDFMFYAATLIACAVLFTWLWLHTRGSLLLAVLFHTMFNALHTTALVGTGDPQLGRIVAIIMCAAAATVVAVERRRFLVPSVTRAAVSGTHENAVDFAH